MKNFTIKLFLLLPIFLSFYEKINACNKPVITGKLKVCEGDEVNFSAFQDSGSTYKWYANAANIISTNEKDSVLIQWNSAGYYKIKVVTLIGNCKDSAEIIIQVLEKPELTDSLLAKGCEGHSFLVDPLESFGLKYKYIFNGVKHDKAFTISNLQVGEYLITAIGINDAGCSDTSIIKLTVFPKPYLNFAVKLLNDSGLIEITRFDSARFGFISFDVIGIPPCVGNPCKIKLPKSGIYKIIYSVTDPKTGCQKRIDTTITVNVPVGIQNFKAFPMQINVFPNPAKNTFIIEYELENNQKIQFYLTDLFGRKIIISEEMTLNIGKQKLILNAEKDQLKPGIYFLHVVSENINYQPVKLLLIN